MSEHLRWTRVVEQVVEQCARPHNFITDEAYAGFRRQMSGTFHPRGDAENMIDLMQGFSQSAKQRALDELCSFVPPRDVHDPIALAELVVARIKNARDFDQAYPNKGYVLVIDTLRSLARESQGRP